MRFYSVVISVCVPFFLSAQDAKQIASYSYDLNGRRVAVGEVTAQGQYQAQTMQSINGRAVPLESVEEKVISEGPGGKIVERLVRRFNPDGRPGATEKIRIEEKPNPDGTVNRNTTVYETGINGSFAMRERMLTTASKSGEVERTETRVERPTINGSLDVEEMRVKVVTGDEKDSHTDLTILRRGSNGGFAEAARELAQTKVQNGETLTTTAEYNAAVTGKMELTGQKVARITKRPDGSEIRVVDVYGTVSPGRAVDGFTSGPRLREQQVIEQQIGNGQSVVETFSVRRADLESGRLGPANKISETVCTGTCLPPKK